MSNKLLITAIAATLIMGGCKKKDKPADMPSAPVTTEVVTETTTETENQTVSDIKTAPQTATIIVNGNEPDWHFKITGDEAIYKTPLNGDGVTIPVTRTQTDNSIQFTGVLDGDNFMLALTKVQCEDSMSGQEYPMTASFLRSDGTYGGCARKE